MNTIKYFRRNRDGSVAMTRVKVTQSIATYRGRSDRPYPAFADREMARRGWTRKRLA